MNWSIVTILQFSLLVLVPVVRGKCHFDKIQLPTDYLSHTSLKYHNRKYARDVERCHSEKWKPIRIRVHYDLRMAIIDHEKFRLHKVIEHAVHRMRSLLSVQPVVGPLLLSRSKACAGVYTSGPNKGRCASIRPGYNVEYCENKVDNFPIPDRHLKGVDIYDERNSTPAAERSIAGGHGVRNADYVLYLTALHTDLCADTNTIAYASYCQLDQNDRPIAGLVNFCPAHLQTAYFSHPKAVLVVMHEMFHALGFSSELFAKYKECSSRGYCFPWKRVITETSNNFRIVLPSVINQMQQHFNCTDEELGAPLEQTSDQSVSSHWDPLILHYSLMSPYISESQLVSVDPITLAVFDDMGWYRVNFSAADMYNWASNVGCNFVKSPKCADDFCPGFLCNLRDEANASGCDYSNSFVAMCSPVSKNYRDLGIYKPLRQGQCLHRKASTENGQACFVSSILGKKEGECIDIRCIESSQELQLFVEEKWLVCPCGSQVVLKEGNHTITCPTYAEICGTGRLEETHHYQEFNHGVALWIQVSSPTPSSTNDIDSSEASFKSRVLLELSRQAGVPPSWINETILIAQEHFLLGLLLVPPPEVAKDEAEAVYSKIHNLNDMGGLNFTYVIAASTNSRPIPEPAWSFQNLRGIYLLLFMLGAVFVVVIIASVGATLIQLAVRRPMTTRARNRREFPPDLH